MIRFLLGIGWGRVLRGGYGGRDKNLSFRNANTTKVGFSLVAGAFFINYWEGSRVKRE